MPRNPARDVRNVGPAARRSGIRGKNTTTHQFFENQVERAHAGSRIDPSAGKLGELRSAGDLRWAHRRGLFCRCLRLDTAGAPVASSPTSRATRSTAGPAFPMLRASFPKSASSDRSSATARPTWKRGASEAKTGTAGRHFLGVGCDKRETGWHQVTPGSPGYGRLADAQPPGRGPPGGAQGGQRSTGGLVVGWEAPQVSVLP